MLVHGDFLFLFTCRESKVTGPNLKLLFFLSLFLNFIASAKCATVQLFKGFLKLWKLQTNLKHFCAANICFSQTEFNWVGSEAVKSKLIMSSRLSLTFFYTSQVLLRHYIFNKRKKKTFGNNLDRIG